jgi:hypothetical protein
LEAPQLLLDLSKFTQQKAYKNKNYIILKSNSINKAIIMRSQKEGKANKIIKQLFPRHSNIFSENIN